MFCKLHCVIDTADDESMKNSWCFPILRIVLTISLAVERRSLENSQRAKQLLVQP